MKIYTYYEQVSSDRAEALNAERLLELWVRNWSSKGWQPVILSDKDARKNPRYKECISRFQTFPTGNNTRYELACFKRWLAMACIGGYHCDFDVMNLRFRGGHTNDLTFYSKYLVPAMVWGSKEDYKRLLDLFMAYDPSGKVHISDQQILVDNVDTFQFEKRYMMPEFMQENNWYNYELVHFPNSRMTHWKMQPRHRYIEMLLDLIENLKK